MSIHLSKDEVVIWSIYLPKFYHLTHSYIHFLDQTEIEMANRFLFSHLRIRYILTHGIVRKLMASYLDLEPFQVEIRKSSFGKPFIEKQSLQFNLSHSQDYAICAFAFEREIGTDIEYKRKEIVDDLLIENILSSQELATYKQLSPLQKIESFFIQWTRKEAFLKALGIGLKKDLRQINMPTQLSDHFLIIEPIPVLSDQTWLLQTFCPTLEYVASLVCQSNSRLPILKFYEYESGV